MFKILIHLFFFFLLLNISLSHDHGTSPGKTSASLFVSSHGDLAQIYTGETFVQSMCIQDTKISAVGSKEDVLRICKKNSNTVLQLEETQMVLPSFSDSHAHLFEGGINLAECNLESAESLESFIEIIQSYIKDHPQKDWIVCRNWVDEKFKKLPSIDTLNEISKEKKILIERWDHHSVLVNQQIMDIANITIDTKFEGGKIDVNEGKLTGYVFEKAIELVDNVVPIPNYDEALESAMKHLNKNGITQVTSMGRSFNYEMNKLEIKTLKKYHDEGKMTIRVYQAVNLQQLDYILDYISKEGKGDDIFKVGLMKEFFDGSLGSRTAYQFVPYLNRPDDFGIKIWEDEEKLKNLIDKALKNELQVSIHAIGSKANYDLLKIYEKLEEKKGRIRIEHAQQIRDEDLILFKNLSVSASMNPAHIVIDDDLSLKIVPKETRHEIHREKEMLETTITGFSSDWPVWRINPFEGLYNVINHRGVDLKRGLDGYTKNNAYISFFDGKLGALEKGYYADFVVVDRNIFTIPKEEIKKTEIVRTYFNGNLVYFQEKETCIP